MNCYQLKLRTIEAIYDVLVGAGLKRDHAAFDDAVYGCLDMVLGTISEAKEPVEAVAHWDESRSVEEVSLDFIEWAAASGCQQPISNVLAQACRQGKEAWGL